MIKQIVFLLSAAAVLNIPAAGNIELDTRMCYNIQAVTSGMVMDIQGGGAGDNVPVIQYRLHNGVNQQFIFFPSGTDGYYLIQVRGSGKYLTAKNGRVLQHSPGSDNAQLWRLIPAGDGFRITGRNGGVMAVDKALKKDTCFVVVSPGPVLTGTEWKLVPALNEKDRAALAAADAYIKNDMAEFNRITGSESGARKGRIICNAARFMHLNFGKTDAALRVYQEARNEGYDEPDLSEFMADAYYSSGNSRKGAACLEEGYREKLSAIAGAPTGQSSREHEKMRDALLSTAAALIDYNTAKLCNFARGPEIYDELMKRGIKLSNRSFQRSCTESVFWAGNEAFGRGDYSTAANLYAAVAALDGVIGEQGKIIERYNLVRIRSILERRKALGTIRPGYIQKHTALFILKFKTRYEGPAGPVTIDNAYTADDLRVRKTIINQDLMARMVEAFTGGRLSIQYDRRYMKDSALTGFYVWDNKRYGKVCGPEVNSFDPEGEIIEIMSATVADTDVYQLYWDKTALPHGEFICFGGSTTKYPVIPYTLSIPRRGFMENHIGRSTGLNLVFHEYFHTVERIGGFKTQDDEANIISYYPEYARTKKALDYWDFMFSTKLTAMAEGRDAKKLEGGWSAFSFSARSPFRMDSSKLKRLTKLALDVPPARRKESHIVQEKAREENNAGRKDEAFVLYEKAFGLNPSFVEFHKISARRSSAAGNHDEAALFMEKYLSFADSSSDARWLGNILIEKLGRTDDAARYYTEAYRLASGKEIARISLDAGWRFYKAGNSEKALAYFEKGLAVDQCDDMLECLFLMGEIFYKQGDTAKGMGLMKQAMDRGLALKKWFQDRYDKLMKKAVTR